MPRSRRKFVYLPNRQEPEVDVGSACPKLKRREGDQMQLI